MWTSANRFYHNGFVLFFYVKSIVILFWENLGTTLKNKIFNTQGFFFFAKIIIIIIYLAPNRFAIPILSSKLQHQLKTKYCSFLSITFHYKISKLKTKLKTKRGESYFSLAFNDTILLIFFPEWWRSFYWSDYLLRKAASILVERQSFLFQLSMYNWCLQDSDWHIEMLRAKLIVGMIISCLYRVLIKLRIRMVLKPDYIRKHYSLQKPFF